jgi:hypothetical protein
LQVHLAHTPFACRALSRLAKRSSAHVFDSTHQPTSDLRQAAVDREFACGHETDHMPEMMSILGKRGALPIQEA